ncbi:MAG TPA: radical SAM protein [Longimicrobium sp.]|nr:radical SAM protein [Longimicrobium sp.]
MKKKVVFVELTIYERIFPLVSGYMQAYACKDPAIAAAYDFEQFTTSVKAPLDDVLPRLIRSAGDIYAFSCYVWNMALVRRVVAGLRAARPDARILLGGPQVMHRAGQYLSRADENLFLANGEGERTFAMLLEEELSGTPDLARVNGISFWRGGELVTTEKSPRLDELDAVPSPFLGGLFKPGYTMAIYETNRGCPFNCAFCYWGAATNSKVYRFSDERVKEELTWLSRNGCVFIYLADANWGIFPRDVELTEHIARLARQYGLPNVVYYSAAKNKPERVTEITGIFASAGVITSQPVSLQTLNQETLTVIGRSNIKLDAYATVQARMNELRISSFTELIWPLPGETLDTLQAGVDQLCQVNAGTIIVYPQLLLNNTALEKRQDELGLVTRSVDDGVGEVKIVVSTAQVGPAEFEQGMRFFYALHLLHNMRTLSLLTRWLAREGKGSHGQVFADFARFCLDHADSPVIRFVEDSISTSDMYDVFNYGKVVHHAMHEDREGFESLVHRFVRTQPWWSEPDARALYELDLVNRPYVYSSTPVRAKGYPFEFLTVLAEEERGYLVELSPRALSLLAEFRDDLPDGGTNPALRVDHDRLQYPYMRSQSLDHNAGYCHGMILRVQNIAPLWTAAAPAAAPVTAEAAAPLAGV